VHDRVDNRTTQEDPESVVLLLDRPPRAADARPCRGVEADQRRGPPCRHTSLGGRRPPARPGLRPGQTDRTIRDLLHPLWPDYVADDPRQTDARRAETAAALRSGRPLYPAAAGGFAATGATAFKTTRSYGS